MNIKVGDRGSFDVEVYLNGALQKLCVEADDEKGFIRQYESNHEGKIKQDESGNAKIVTRYGQVKIFLKKR